jgi:hypothetical protein
VPLLLLVRRAAAKPVAAQPGAQPAAE